VSTLTGAIESLRGLNFVSCYTTFRGDFAMKTFFSALVLGAASALGASALSGCNSNSGAADKMTDNKAGMEDKMMNDKMTGDKMAGDKMTGDKMTSDKMSADKMRTDKAGK
jgi:pentapeptide MXKDX repeat protein